MEIGSFFLSLSVLTNTTLQPLRYLSGQFFFNISNCLLKMKVAVSSVEKVQAECQGAGLPAGSPGGRFFGEVRQRVADVVLVQQEHVGSGQDQGPGLEYWSRVRARN